MNRSGSEDTRHDKLADIDDALTCRPIRQIWSDPVVSWKWFDIPPSFQSFADPLPSPLESPLGSLHSAFSAFLPALAVVPRHHYHLSSWGYFIPSHATLPCLVNHTTVRAWRPAENSPYPSTGKCIAGLHLPAVGRCRANGINSDRGSRIGPKGFPAWSSRQRRPTHPVHNCLYEVHMPLLKGQEWCSQVGR